MTITIPGLPPLAWTHGEGSAHLNTDGSDADGPTLTLTSRGHVDWIIDAGGNPAQVDATALVFEPGDGDFTLSARVSVEDPRGTFDAAVLVIYSDDEYWAKLCFEYSPQGEEMIVSVITNTFSDDCNSSVATVAAPYLRITRSGPAWALHHSIDGEHWAFVRFFRLLTAAPARVGFLSQAPMADTCVAHFDRIRFAEGAPTDLRNGD